MTYVHSLPHFPLPRQTPILAFIVALHVAFIAMINGPIHVTIPRIYETQATFIPIEPVRPTPQPIPEPRGPSGPTTTVVQPKEPGPVAIDFRDNAQPQSGTGAEIGATGADTHPAQITSPTIDPRHPIGRPEYPAASRRLGEMGLVVVRACVATDGRIDSVAVQTSSGHPRLDEAAVHHLRQPGLRMTPGREDGRPVDMCAAVPFRFTIDR